MENLLYSVNIHATSFLHLYIYTYSTANMYSHSIYHIILELLVSLCRFEQSEGKDCVCNLFISESVWHIAGIQ